MELQRWETPEERRGQILGYILAHNRSSVADLSQHVATSEVTVRKDLDALEAQGLVLRVHGGAVASGRGRLEQTFGSREQEQIDEKRRIAAAATQLIRAGQTVFLDASTTCLQIARLIKGRSGLTVVTNGLYTALELSFSEQIRTLVVGGMVRAQSSSLVGSLSLDLIERLQLDIGFFGARGISARAGLTETDTEEAQLKMRMVRASLLVVGVADSSKFGRVSLTSFALPGEIDRLFTTDAAPAPILAELRERGVEVTLV